MNIRETTIADQEQWDTFVHAHSTPTPYQLFGWPIAIEKTYNFKSISFLAESDNKISGILPTTLFNIPLGSSSLISLPYCDVASTLTTDEYTGEALLNYAITYAENNNISNIVIRGKIPKNYSSKNAFSLSQTRDKVRMILKLPASPDELWSTFKSKLRSQIRKAEKNNLVFRFANKNTNDFFKVFSHNMRDLGSPVHSPMLFQHTFKQLDKQVQVGLVYNGQQVIGAGIIMHAGNTISIPWASTLRSYNNLNPNMLLYWQFLKYATEQGCTHFDFGRSTPGEGTFRFKSQWGAQATPLTWTTIHIKEKPVKRVTTRTNRKREVVANLWQHLPLPFANFLGPYLRKYISL